MKVTREETMKKLETMTKGEIIRETRDWNTVLRFANDHGFEDDAETAKAVINWISEISQRGKGK